MWAAAALGLTACSLILDFNPEGLPCDLSNKEGCLEGFSCNSPSPNTFICVGDQSLANGSVCQLDRQCPTGTICPTGVNLCVTPCDLSQAYVASSPNCPAYTYCRPVLSTGMFSDGAAHPAQRVAGCVPTDSCTPGQACNSNLVQGGICADMRNSAAACVVGCEVKFNATAYADNCGADVNGNPRFCQPLGPGPGLDVLACLDAGTTPQPAGSPCGNPVAQPCAPGTGCIHNVCRAYTNLSTNVNACTSGLTPCDLHVNANTLVGYCSNDPSCTK
jgi:hypothetical protein